MITGQALERGDPGQLDPRFRAGRNPQTGQWMVRIHERGALQETRRSLMTTRCAQYLLSHVLRHLFPRGWQIDTTWAGAVDKGASAARRWWAGHSDTPYLDAHRTDGA